MDTRIYAQHWAETLKHIPRIDLSKAVMTYTITTTVDVGRKTVILEHKTGTLRDISLFIAETKEAQLRKALIALGWTPPPRVRWWHRLFNIKPALTDEGATQPVSGQGRAGAGEGKRKD